MLIMPINNEGIVFKHVVGDECLWWFMFNMADIIISGSVISVQESLIPVRDAHFWLTRASDVMIKNGEIW